MSLLNATYTTPKQGNVLLAMPLFKDNNSYQLNKIIDSLETFWDLDITDIAGDSDAAVFNVEGEEIALMNMPIPIPEGDIEGTAKYAYNWPSALQDLEGYTGHAIVSVMTSTKSPLDRFRILSKVLASILMTSKAIGIYQGSQSLLIPRGQYLSYVEELQENQSPIMLWIYIGLRESETGNSVYTYGLKDFEKSEIEIIDSELALDELLNLLFNVSSYVVDQDVILKNGETIGVSKEQKISIKLSKGQFVDGDSLKLVI
jgi:hypothetical protein